MTTCIYGFYKNGKYKVTYCNSDGYPSGFGKNVVSFIRENTVKDLHSLYDKLKTVDRKKAPSKKERFHLSEKGLYLKDDMVWEEIATINEGFMTYYLMDVYFIPDFIEWFEHVNYKYIINLDNNTFNVYQSNKKTVEYELSNIPKDWFVNE